MAFVPGAPFYAHQPDRRTLRLSFVTSTVEQIDQGMGILAKVVRGAGR
jgi:2-aminoadipate transaminase